MAKHVRGHRKPYFFFIAMYAIEEQKRHGTYEVGLFTAHPTSSLTFIYNRTALAPKTRTKVLLFLYTLPSERSSTEEEKCRTKQSHAEASIWCYGLLTT